MNVISKQVGDLELKCYLVGDLELKLEKWVIWNSKVTRWQSRICDTIIGIINIT